MSAFGDYTRDNLYDAVKENIKDDLITGLPLHEAVERAMEVVTYALAGAIQEAKESE